MIIDQDDPNLKWYNKKRYYNNELFTGLVLSEQGNKFYYKNGLRHRKDGPAIEYNDGHKTWFYEGKEIKANSLIEFKKEIYKIFK